MTLLPKMCIELTIAMLMDIGEHSVSTRQERWQSLLPRILILDIFRFK